MNEYNKKRNMGHVKFTNICTSATLKSHAKSFEEVVTGNFFVPVLLKIPLMDDIN